MSADLPLPLSDQGVRASRPSADRVTDASHGAPEGSPPSGSVPTDAEAAAEIERARAIIPELLGAVERARRHAMNIGITDGSYLAQLDAAIAKATGPDATLSQSTRAKATLMAAAPELFEAVLQYRDDLKYPLDPDSADRRRTWVEGLVAKVLGQ